MLDRKKVIIEQGLYKRTQSIEDQKLNTSSTNTSKTEKTATQAVAYASTQPEQRRFITAKRNYKGGSSSMMNLVKTDFN